MDSGWEGARGGSVAMAESWRGGGTLIFNFSTTSLGFGSGSHSCRPPSLNPRQGWSRSSLRNRASLEAGGSWRAAVGSRYADLRSKMSGWQKCLNAITNLTFHITSKRQSLSQLESKSTRRSQRQARYIRAMLNSAPPKKKKQTEPGLGLAGAS